VDNLLKEDKVMAENQGGSGNKLVYFLIGAGIGTITALLFAPKAGSELRSEFADATRKGLDYARNTGHEIGERASDLTTRGKEAVSDLTDLGKDLINRQRLNSPRPSLRASRAIVKPSNPLKARVARRLRRQLSVLP